ncbi:MAG: polyprenyl synthetase family protein [bacterium]|nr:polyprenyl synthetase family protein [bacterium]
MVHIDGRTYIEAYAGKFRGAWKEFSCIFVHDARVRGELPGELASYLDAIGVRGKALRGALVSLGYRLGGGIDERIALDAGVSLELLHTGLLLEDDYMDADTKRRGMPSCHIYFTSYAKKKRRADPSRFGVSMAMLASDLAFYLGWERLYSLAVDHEILAKTARLFSSYFLRVIHGQTLDVFYSGKEPTEREILEVLRLKTAEYTGVLPLLTGATLAGQSQSVFLKNLTRYGLALGWAFQIQDDILGMFGDERRMGKSVGSDIQEKKSTLLMSYVFTNGSGACKEKLRTILRKKSLTKKDIRNVQCLLRESGAYESVKNRGFSYIQEAQKVVPLLTNDPYLRTVLSSLAGYMMERAT